ncbi:MAG: c-type cytochrome [Planctomycetota bacterium]|nr:c-type cytochrome [Planctomycetota bacterium]
MAKKSSGPSIVPHHIAFAAGCALLLASTFYAFVQDYSDREYVRYQAQYDQLEYERIWNEKTRIEEELGANQLKQLELLQKKKNEEERIRANREPLDEARKKVQALEDQLGKLRRDLNFAGTDVDVFKYQFVAAAEDERGTPEQVGQAVEGVDKQKNYRLELFNKVQELEKQKAEPKKVIESFEKPLAEIEKELAGLFAKADDLKRSLKKVHGNTVINMLRDLPGADFIGPKRNLDDQIIVNNLPVDMKWTTGPRYDRCVSCHKAIASTEPMYSRATYDKQLKEVEALEAAGREEDAAYLRGQLVPTVMRSHPRLDLFLGANGPHPMKEFGCTVCHQGRPMGTSFLRAAHSPRNEKQKHEWIETYGWSEMHHHLPSVPMWDDMMIPMQYIESSCRKCHTGVDKVPQAPTLNAGLELFREQGCANCHMGDTHPDFAWLGRVGPDLRRLGEKADAGWVRRWIENPWHFRPGTKMPRFFGLENRGDAHDRLGSDLREPVEVEAISTYLLAASRLRQKDLPPPPAGDVEAGKLLFETVGCLGCHGTQEMPKQEERYAFNDHGPDLSRVGEKLAPAWLFQWLKNPHEYWPESRMPSLRLSDKEAADLTAFLSTAMKSAAPPSGEPPKASEAALDLLITDMLRNNMPGFRIEALLRRSRDAGPRHAPQQGQVRHRSGFGQEGDTGQGEWTEAQIGAVLNGLNEMGQGAAEQARLKKAFYAGQALIQQHGCFGCHNIQGWTYAPLTCVNLQDEGSKSIDRFDFGMHDLVGIPETRWDWFYLKLTRPRVFDLGKQPITASSDRLRMPWFGFQRDTVPADEEVHPAHPGHGDEHGEDAAHKAAGGGHGPARSALSVALANQDEGRQGQYGLTHRQVEQLVTVLLSFTLEHIPQAMQKQPDAEDLALDRGERVVHALNCAGCHLVGMEPADVMGRGELRGKLLLEGLVTRDAQMGAKALGLFADEDVFSLDAPEVRATGFLNFGRGTYLTETTLPLALTEKKVRRAEEAPLEAVGFRFERNLNAVPEGERRHWVKYGELVAAERFAELVEPYLTADKAAKAYSSYSGRFVDKRAYERLAGTAAFGEASLKGSAHYLTSVQLGELKGKKLFYEPVWLSARWTKGEGRIVDHLIAMAKKLKGDTASQQDAPPSLAFEGGKVQPDWFYKFLHQVHTLRPGLQVRMPSFWAQEGHEYKAVYPAGRLSAVDPDRRPAGIEGEPMPPGKSAVPDAAREIVEYFGLLAKEPPYGFQTLPEVSADMKAEYEKGYALLFSPDKGGLGCNKCHMVGQYQPKEPVGPNLAIAKRRFKPDWLRRFASFPAAIYPWTNMPANFYDWSNYNADLNDPLRGIKKTPAELKEIAEKLKAVELYLNTSGEVEIGAQGEP